MLTWWSSCVIANYNWKTSEIYLSKRVILLFEVDDAKKHMCENIMPVIDRGVFHNYVHLCKQLFLYEAIRSHCWESTSLSWGSHLFKPGVKGRRVPGFLKLLLSAMSVCVRARVCVCVCPPPPPRLLITSGVIWGDTELLWLVKQVLDGSLLFIWQLKS